MTHPYLTEWRESRLSEWRETDLAERITLEAPELRPCNQVAAVPTSAGLLIGCIELLGGEPTGEDMDKERIRDEAESFFEWPTHDKTHVTTTSMLIFAGVIAGMAAEEAVRAEKAWRKDAEAVLEKMASEGWITDALQAEGVAGISKALLSLKREARGVLSKPSS